MLASSLRGASRLLARPSAALAGRALSSGAPNVTLRYFDSRGRAQGIRYALKDAEVEFKDERVSLQHIISGNWFNLKADPNISGPFGVLPVLHWDSYCIGQTEAIAGYLYHKLGHGEGLSLEESATSAALVSCAHQDVIVMCLQVLNVVGTAPDLKDEQIGQAVQSCTVRMNGILPRLEKLVGGKDFFLKDAPVMGDYCIYDALDQAKLILGDSVLDPHPGLKAFMDRMANRPNIAKYVASGERPLFLTGAPQEAQILQKIQNVPKL
eukprot:CAMPEP_0173437258 /NCGR_PEP_ID=MMETSP1357-20121228/17927_1 /TAXON_ID=77926 /ORGANISM="Hemiselmis rufescens, Strain PCC563" /LENGTH=266 /DNA_ID=CAMNT_0014402427 /DNA_START=12 /DNA_END=812 /DNA_ORIENTATION=-